MANKLVNAVLFQVGWFACVLGGGAWLWVAVAVVIAHVLRFGEARLIVTVTILGTLLDSALGYLGVFDFNNGSAWIPLWLVLLWAVLATTLNHCLAWTARPWWLASLLGAIAGPASYYAGAQLAGVQLPLGSWPSVLLLAGVWAVVFPMLHRLRQLDSTSRA